MLKLIKAPVMHKLMTAGLFLSGMLFQTLTLNAQSTQTVTKSYTLATINSSNSLNVSVPSFDTTLGELTGVSIHFSLSNQDQNNYIAIENLSATGAVTLQSSNNNKTLRIKLDVEGSKSNATIPVFKYSNLPHNLSTYDGLNDFAGTSGVILTDSIINYSYQQASTDINSFKGNGVIEAHALTIDTLLTSFMISAGGNNISNIRSYYSVSVDVIYTYNIPSSTPLALSILNFEAEATNEGNMLSWLLADAKALKTIEIERSAIGETFKTIAVLLDPQTEKQFQDKDLKAATYLYRLKITDYSGNAIYSDIKKLTNPNLSLPNDIAVYPNPAIDNTVYIQNGKDIKEVVLSGVNGTTYQLKPQVIDNNTISISLPKKLPTGIYYISIASSSGTISKKLIVK